MYCVNLHTDARGYCPVRELIEMLDAGTSKESRVTLDKLYYQIERIENKGTRAGTGVTKHIKDDIWELRPAKYRVFYIVDGDQIYLLNWFRKETNKTPASEIQKAENLYKDYLDWKKNHGQ